MDSIIYNKIETEADGLAALLNGLYPLQTITDQAIASFTDGADNIPVVALTIGIEPVQSGSGDPSPENVRPISGWTGAKVTRTGANIIDITNTFAYSDGNLKGTEVNIPAGTVVYFQKSGGTESALYGRKKDGTVFEIGRIFSTASNATIPYDITAIGISTGAAQYYQTGDICMVSLMQFTSLVPYTAQPVTITLGQTVYGGTLNVLTGLLTVTDGYIASYNGETLPGTWISDRDVYAGGSTPTTGAQVVYKLAEAQTYQLAAQEIRTIYGTNNIWADTGDVESLTYRADLGLYLSNQITTLQALVLENNG